jgi:hypothetical protein
VTFVGTSNTHLHVIFNVQTVVPPLEMLHADNYKLVHLDSTLIILRWPVLECIDSEEQIAIFVYIDSE